MPKRICNYADRERRERINAKLGDGLIPDACSSKIEYRNGEVYYCGTHGAWSLAFNPFSGIKRIKGVRS